MVVVYYEGGYCPTDPFTEPSLPRWLRELVGYDFFFDVVAAYTFQDDFGDDEASHLRALTSLTTLRLDDGKISDVGLEHLAGLTSLEELGLCGTQITDAGLEYLFGLRGLTLLDLTDTRVTAEGVRKLQRALSKCEIVYDE